MKIRLLPVLVMTLAIGGCSGESQEPGVLPVRDDAQAPSNLAWWSRAAIDAFMRISAWRGAQSGYIALFARDGVPVYGNMAGWKDIDTREPLAMDTPVRIASMTKPITAVGAMMLVEEGRIALDDPVAKYLPEFAELKVATRHHPDADGTFPARSLQTPLTIRHLLTFSSGLGPGRGGDSPLVDYWDRKGIYEQPSGDLARRVSALAALPLLEEPGTRWRYGFSLDVLARIIEVVSGESIASYLHSRIFAPLGMHDTRYLPPEEERGALATVYTQDRDGELVKAPLPYDTDWTPGGGGLVSTAADYMRFALMLWNGGEYRGVRILDGATVAEMTRLHVPDGVLAEEGIEGLGWGLGMAVVADEDASITPDRTGDFWWAGYYGTTFFVSPATGLVGVILTQNEPGEFSPRPIEVYVIQGLALAGS